ncbi:MAG: hypothetical protein QXH91_04490, partial [Candidatus Bathyarchaeia archaeon]
MNRFHIVGYVKLLNKYLRARLPGLEPRPSGGYPFSILFIEIRISAYSDSPLNLFLLSILFIEIPLQSATLVMLVVLLSIL